MREKKKKNERGRKGGLFSSACTSSTAAFSRSKAHGRGSHPPALPASLTPDTIPLVSQQTVDFIAVVCFLAVYGVCLLPWYADTVKSAVQRGIC